MENRAVEGVATPEDGRPRIFVFHGDSRYEKVLSHAGGSSFHVERVYRLSDLRKKLGDVAHGSIAVVDAHVNTGAAKLAPEIRDLAWEFPLVPVISIVRRSADVLSQIRCLANWGVTDVILDSERLPEVIEHVLKTAQPRAFNRIGLMLSHGAGESARGLIAAAAKVAMTGGGKEELARHFFMSPRTLVRRCKMAGLPPPRRLVGLIRLLIAGELLEDTDLSIVQVSLAAGYHSENSFRRSLKELTNLTPAAIRQSGALKTVLKAFDSMSQKDRIARRPPSISWTSPHTCAA